MFNSSPTRKSKHFISTVQTVFKIQFLEIEKGRHHPRPPGPSPDVLRVRPPPDPRLRVHLRALPVRPLRTPRRRGNGEELQEMRREESIHTHLILFRKTESVICQIDFLFGKNNIS